MLDGASGEVVEATLFDEVSEAHFLETQSRWRPVVIEAARALAAAGQETDSLPQHWHWDWTRKGSELRMLALTFYGIEYKGSLEGLMKVNTVSHVCRLPEQIGKALLYVDYLEVAPWNVGAVAKALGRTPRYRAVGTRLLEAAVRQSLQEGFRGRVGLHTLPQSEGFYVERCGMAAVEPDLTKQALLWCEYSPEAARRFIAREKR